MDTGHKVILKSWILMYWLQTLAKQFSTKVLKFGTLFLFQSLVCQNLFSFTTKLQEFLPHICSTYSLFNYCVVSQVALSHKPSGYLGLLTFYKL